MVAKADVDRSPPNDVHHLQVQVRHNIHMILFSPAGLQVKASQVKLQAFYQEKMDFGWLDGVLVGRLKQV